MATSKRTRAFMGFLAALFLLTSSALTIGVIYQTFHSDSSSTSSPQATNQQNQDQNKLQGTKLSGFTPLAKITSLKEEDLSPGKGAVVKTGDTVTVDYTGAVASTGIIFQSSKDSGQPIPLQLKSGSVIEGWVKGIPGMKVGGTRRLLIPAKLAYGASPPQGSGIPANASLVFDVTVHKIGQ